MKKYFVFWLLVPAMVLVFARGAACAAFWSYKPLEQALPALDSDSEVEVKNIFNVYYVFKSKAAAPAKGFIIYPGGMVDFRSYAPLARAIAAQGYLTVLVHMPLDIAFLGYKRAGSIISSYPGIKTWAIGGHSLGGVAACSYARENSDKVSGVVLWASYPSSSFSLSNTTLKVISIYGTKDGPTDALDIAKSHQDLPPDTLWVPIEGGNHTQFGWYEGEKETGLQKGDNPADISREEQQRQILDATADFLDTL